MEQLPQLELLESLLIKILDDAVDLLVYYSVVREPSVRQWAEAAALWDNGAGAKCGCVEDFLKSDQSVQSRQSCSLDSCSRVHHSTIPYLLPDVPTFSFLYESLFMNRM